MTFSQIREFINHVLLVHSMHKEQGIPYCEIEQFLFGERTHTLYYMMRMCLARRVLRDFGKC